MECRGILSHKGCFLTFFVFFVCMILKVLYWANLQTEITGVFIQNDSLFGLARLQKALWETGKAIVINRTLLIQNTDQTQSMYGHDETFLVRNTDERHISLKKR